jgi:hypothetical protein
MKSEKIVIMVLRWLVEVHIHDSLSQRLKEHAKFIIKALNEVIELL